MDITVFVRDPDRVLRGPLPVLTGEAILRQGAVGSWHFTMDARHAKAVRVVPGGGVVAVDDETNEVVFSGPLTSPVREGSATGPQRILTMTGVTDEVHLADRIPLPDPTRSDVDQSLSTQAYYTDSGPAETVAKTLVNLQAGPGAIAARRVAGLVVEPDTGAGNTVSLSARYSPNIADILAEMSVLGGISWRVVYDLATRDLVFKVTTPRDLSRRVRFSRKLGNLGAFSSVLQAPTVTDVTVLAQGELTARKVVHVATTDPAATAWRRRIEQPKDRRDTDTDDVLVAAGLEALADGGPVAGVSYDTTDLPRIRPFRDYELGDVVSVELDDGAVVDQAQQVTLTWAPGGVRAKPLIGPASVRDPNEPPSVRLIKQLKKRVGRLEGTP